MAQSDRPWASPPARPRIRSTGPGVEVLPPMKLFPLIAAAALTVGAAPVQGQFQFCTEPPPGMEWIRSKKPELVEASINNKPYVGCIEETIGSILGEGYYQTIWKCPTFFVVQEDGGLAGRLKSVSNQFMPKYYEKWDVVDKNGSRWNIFSEGSGSGLRPVKERTSEVFPGGCKATYTIELSAPNINLTIRTSWVEVLKQKAVPTF